MIRSKGDISTRLHRSLAVLTHRGAVLAAVALVAMAPAAASGKAAIRLTFFGSVSPRVDFRAARALFADVNATRARHGLPALVNDARLAGIALAVARNMVAHRYFGHTDLRGVTFADRMRISRYPFSVAAENMSFDRDESGANTAFQHSAEHYSNIIDPEQVRLGVAVVVAGDGQVFFVEDFAG